MLEKGAIGGREKLKVAEFVGEQDVSCGGGNVVYVSKVDAHIQRGQASSAWRNQQRVCAPTVSQP